MGKGRHRLFINGEMRNATGVDVDDRITIELEYDAKPRTMPVPKQFVRALKENPSAKRVWENLNPSHRKEILSYLNSLKRAETLDRNVERTIKILLTRTDVNQSRKQR